MVSVSRRERKPAVFFSKAARDLLFALPTDRIAQTMAFVEPIMDHWSVQVAYTYPLSLAEHSLRVWSRYLD